MSSDEMGPFGCDRMRSDEEDAGVSGCGFGWRDARVCGEEPTAKPEALGGTRAASRS